MGIWVGSFDCDRCFVKDKAFFDRQDETKDHIYEFLCEPCVNIVDPDREIFKEIYW